MTRKILLSIVILITILTVGWSASPVSGKPTACRHSNCHTGALAYSHLSQWRRSSDRRQYASNHLEFITQY